MLVLSAATLTHGSSDAERFVKELFTAFVQTASWYTTLQFVWVDPYRSLVSTQSLPPNVKVTTSWDESDTNPKLVITDGDHHAVQTALVARVPLLLFPIWPEQETIGNWVSTHRAGHVMTDRHQFDSLTSTVAHLLLWKHGDIPLAARAFLSPHAFLMNEIPLRSGDVLLGCNADRYRYLKERDLEPRTFGLNNAVDDSDPLLLEWTKYRSTPCVLDNYLEMLRCQFKKAQCLPIPSDPLGIGHHPDIKHYLLLQQDYRLTSHQIAQACGVVIDALVHAGYQLHFLVPAFDAQHCPVTRAEFIHILRFHNHRVDRQIFFYTLEPCLQRVHIYHDPFAYNAVRLYELELHQLALAEVIPTLEQHLRSFDSAHALIRLRDKPSHRILQRLWQENERPRTEHTPRDCFADIFGYRVVFLKSSHVKCAQERLHRGCSSMAYTARLMEDDEEEGEVGKGSAFTHCVFQLPHGVEVQLCTHTHVMLIDAQVDRQHKVGFFTSQELECIDRLKSRLVKAQERVDGGIC
jgi:hypothetical protein